MYAYVGIVTYDQTNPPSEEAGRQFAALITAAPGYRGRLGIDLGAGRRLHVYTFDSEEALRQGLGNDAMHHLTEEQIRPHYAAPSERVGRGPILVSDLPPLAGAVEVTAQIAALPFAAERRPDATLQNVYAALLRQQPAYRGLQLIDAGAEWLIVRLIATNLRGAPTEDTAATREFLLAEVGPLLAAPPRLVGEGPVFVDDRAQFAR